MKKEIREIELREFLRRTQEGEGKKYITQSVKAHGEFSPEIGRVMDELKDRLDSSEYQEKESTTLKDDLELLSSEFQRVALFRSNIMRVGRNGAFRDYLQGLPSHINLPFYYNDMFNFLADILEIPELKDELIKVNHETGLKLNLHYSIDASSMSEVFYTLIERAINELLLAHELPTLFDLDIIN